MFGGFKDGWIFLDLAGALVGIGYLVGLHWTLGWVQDLAGWLFGQILHWLGWRCCLVGLEWQFCFVGLGW